MPVTNEFIHAWRAWRRSARPYSSYSEGQVEHDLSHMESYLYGIGLHAIAEKALAYAEIAKGELSDLDVLSQQLESSDIAAAAKEALRNQVALIRALWLSIQELGDSGGAIQHVVGPERG